MNVNLNSNFNYDFYRVSGNDTEKAGKATGLKGYGVGEEETKTKDRAERSSQDIKAEKEEARKKLTEQTRAKLDDTYSKLSDRAKEYLDSLKEKYQNMDFFVADDTSEQETQNIMSNSQKQFSVMMDSATLEKMAADEETAAQYESMILQSAEELGKLKEDLQAKGLNVKEIGMQIEEDGKTTYYSVLDDSLSYYEKELEKQQEKKAKRQEEKKAEEKREAKKEELQEERQAQEEKRQKQIEELIEEQLNANSTLVTAGTIEELKDKLSREQDKVEQLKRGNISVGTGYDFSV